MEKVKKLLLISSILLVLIIAVIYFFNKSAKKKEENSNPITYVATYYTEKVTNSIDFYTIKNICNTYVQRILYGDSEEIYAMLDPKYIKEFGITTNNVISKLEYSSYSIEQNENIKLNVTIEDMYSIRNDDSIYLYFVYGYVKDNIKNKKEEFNLMVEQDKKNNTYYILPEDYMNKYNYSSMKEKQKIQIDLTQIKANSYYNKYDNIIIKDEDIIGDYFKQYKDAILHDKQEAYNLLEEEYRNKRFGSFENFEKYVQENIKEIYLSDIDKYSVSNKNNYTQYVCIDESGNYYIFKKYNVAEFKILLDEYTIISQDFLEKYNSTNAQGKVALNIDKFIKAINNSDYNYAYNCLSKGFKNNYFKSVNEFKTYIESELYKNNEISYEVFSQEGELYKYKVKITNKETKENITKNFIVKLNEGTDFELSFNMD